MQDEPGFTTGEGFPESGDPPGDPFNEPVDPEQGYPPPPPSREERTWALIAYLGGRLLPILAPIGVYVAKRDESPFVAFHAKQSLMLDIATLAVSAAAFALAYMLQLIPLAGWIMGRLMLIGTWAVLVCWLLGGIVLAIQAFDGQRTRVFGDCCGL
jgi:uncharacterized protein